MKEAATKPHPPQAKRLECSRPNREWKVDLFPSLLRPEDRRVYVVAFLDEYRCIAAVFALAASAPGAFRARRLGPGPDLS